MALYFTREGNMALPFQSAASSAARRYSNVIAAALLAATSAVAPIPAAARDVEGLPPHCAKISDKIAQLKCGSAYYQQMRRDAEARSAAAKERIAEAKGQSADAKARGAAADVRGAAADARGVAADARGAAADRRGAAADARLATGDARSAEAEKEGVCLRAIMTDLETNGSKTASLTEPPRKGEACRVARSLKLVAG